MKTLAALLLVLPIALVVASNGDCKSHVSKTYKIVVSLSIKPLCNNCECLDQEKIHSRYMKVVEKSCKKGRCTVVSLEGNCTPASGYSFTIILSFPCPACKKSVDRVTNRLKKKGLKIKLKRKAYRLKALTVSTPQLINYVCATEPPTTESPLTTLEPTTQVLTTAPPPTTPIPTTIQATNPPPIEYSTESGSQGVVTVSPRKCVTLCGECSFTNDPNVMVVLLSFAPKTPQCPGLTFSDGECNDNNPDIKPTYVEPHTHISKSRCACVCFPRTCPAKETVAKLFYSSYQAPLEEMLRFVLQLDEAQPLAQDETLLAKLTAALCDKSKSLALVGDPALAELLRAVPPKYALQFLGRKRK